MKIIWTKKAKLSFSKVLDYLNENWTEKEINNFALQTTKILSLIKDNPFMYIASDKKKNIRKGFINKKVSLFYKVKKQKNEIELLLFWDNMQDPENLKY